MSTKSEMQECLSNKNIDKHSIFECIVADFNKYTKYMRIIDPLMIIEKKRYFEDYLFILGSARSLVLKTLVYLIFALLFCFFCIYQAEIYSTQWYLFNSSLVGVLIMSPITFYAILNKNPFVSIAKQYIIILCTILMGFMMFARVHGGVCDDTSFTQMWHCNPQATSKSLPQDFAILLMLLPISEVNLLLLITNNVYI